MNMKRPTDNQRQWLWFVVLFVGRMAAMAILAGVVRLLLRM